MTDQINDQISAFIDDELPDEESAFLLRRLERDPDARSRALRYTVIGAALRNELLGPDAAILRRRIAVALTGAPPLPLPAQRVPARWHSRYLKPLVGVGIAASVAVGAIGGLRMLTDARLGTVAPAGALTATSLQPRAVDTPPSYVVPQEVADAPAFTPAVRLTNYVMHHSEYASRLNQTFVRSNVVGAAEIVPRAEPPPPQPPPQFRQTTTPE